MKELMANAMKEGAFGISTGLYDYVIVNGQLALSSGEWTGVQAGKVLYRTSPSLQKQ